jgi:peptidoglycan/LPS O-acetylase OafA/YrhL
VRITYRPEIDGLRAISVLAVIIYHANLVLFGQTLFQGGFIGVDIFFVISGYLITTLILKEIYETNQFSFKYFYERRIRRILPALFLVIIVTSIISYFILLPSSLIDFGRSIVSIIFFFSNFYFWFTGGNYAEDNELLKPSLHTWSLSVEEQFYIFFPIFLVIIIKFFKKKLHIILFLIFLIGLLFSEYCARTHPSFNFYMVFSRVFELLFGSLISYFRLNNRSEVRKSYSILNQICPSIGIILVFFAFWFFNFAKIFHPSVITLIPLTGVALIIWFSKKGELITEILSSKILVFFGLISYSLYLWHYPIFAYLRYIEVFNNSIWIKLLATILTIIISILSYYFIEKPFRNKNIISVKLLATYILISAILLLGYSYYILKTEGIKSRFPNIVIDEQINPNTMPIWYKSTGGKLGDVFLIGDSHAAVLKYHLNNELVNKSYNFFSFGCCRFYLTNFNPLENKRTYDILDYEYDKLVDRFLLENKNLVVIWSQRWSYHVLNSEFYDNEYGQNPINIGYFNPSSPIGISATSLEERVEYLQKAIKASANNILKQGHTLILVYPVPEMGFDVRKNYKSIFQKILTINKNIDIKVMSIDYHSFKERNKKIYEILDGIQGPNIYKVYPEKYFCNTIIENRCIANDTEHFIYQDNNHLSLYGSKYIVNGIIKVMEQIEVNKKTNK